MINYELAHKIYCMAIMQNDTSDFVNAPAVLEWLHKLDDAQQAESLKLRCEGVTWREIGKKFDVTQKRIRQLVAKAIRRLRADMTANKDFNLSKKIARLESRELALQEQNKAIIFAVGLIMKDIKHKFSESTQKSTENIGANAMSTKTEDLDLSVRTFNCLARAGIRTVENFCDKTYNELIRIRNLGRKSLDEVISKISALGVVGKWEVQD